MHASRIGNVVWSKELEANDILDMLMMVIIKIQYLIQYYKNFSLLNIQRDEQNGKINTKNETQVNMAIIDASDKKQSKRDWKYFKFGSKIRMSLTDWEDRKSERSKSKENQTK